MSHKAAWDHPRIDVLPSVKTITTDHTTMKNEQGKFIVTSLSMSIFLQRSSFAFVNTPDEYVRFACIGGKLFVGSFESLFQVAEYSDFETEVQPSKLRRMMDVLQHLEEQPWCMFVSGGAININTVYF